MRADLRAEQVMTKNPQAVTPQATVADAVRIMQAEHCGVVPVITGDTERTIVGIVTDRDIALRACNSGARGPEEPISAVMSTHLFCVHPDEGLTRVREVMENAGVRRVPVVDNGDHLLGIISLKDVADELPGAEVGQTDDKILGQRPNN